MKILYGVQATGNGHITRARAMQPELKTAGFEVDFLFSGRPREAMFDMALFGDFIWRRGLSFVTEKGRVRNLKTVLHNNLWILLRDVLALDLTGYDVVLTDFEPVTAWAAKLKGKPCVGLGHQYAFLHDIPRAGRDHIADLILKCFAPAQRTLGLHWARFDDAILPPVLELNDKVSTVDTNKVLVYLALDDVDDIVNWLQPIEEGEFYIYCNCGQQSDKGNIHLRTFSRQGFQQDLLSCSGVITNAGFELLGEAMHYGKKLLVRPLQGQMEQQCNARALETLAYGEVIHDLDAAVVKDWLAAEQSKPQPFPNTARAIARWLHNGMVEKESRLAEELWAGRAS